MLLIRCKVPHICGVESVLGLLHYLKTLQPLCFQQV